MNLSFKESYFIKKLPNMEGGFGYLATHRSLEDGTVIKVIKKISKEKEINIKGLINSKVIENSGYPTEEFKIDNVLKGFIMYHYPKAHTFYYVVNRNIFSHEERVKASIECAKQLKKLHNKDYIFNDIALLNQLIDKNGGHMIDFDSATKHYEKQNVESHYYLTLNGNTLKSSYNTDKLKQALTNLALIYRIDLEEIINNRTNDILSILELFKENSDIYSLLESYLYTDNTPYFDILKESLKDEEKVMFESAKIYRKAININ